MAEASNGSNLKHVSSADRRELLNDSPAKLILSPSIRTANHMPSAMDDPRVFIVSPRPRDPPPVVGYEVDLATGSTARMIAVHHSNSVSTSLIAYLTKEMNNEV